LAIFQSTCIDLVVKATTPPTLIPYDENDPVLPLYQPRNDDDYDIKVPAGSVDAYKAAPGWKNVADKIYAM